MESDVRNVIKFFGTVSTSKPNSKQNEEPQPVKVKTTHNSLSTTPRLSHVTSLPIIRHKQPVLLPSNPSSGDFVSFVDQQRKVQEKFLNSPINKDIPIEHQTVHSKFFHGKMHSIITPSLKKSPFQHRPAHPQLSQSKFEELKNFKMNKM